VRHLLAIQHLDLPDGLPRLVPLSVDELDGVVAIHRHDARALHSVAVEQRRHGEGRLQLQDAVRWKKERCRN